jgi:effector-binding domain-containing protein
MKTVKHFIFAVAFASCTLNINAQIEQSEDNIPVIVETKTEPVVALVKTVTTHPDSIGNALGLLYLDIMEVVTTQGLEPASAPFAVYTNFAPGESVTIEAAVPFGGDVTLSDSINIDKKAFPSKDVVGVRYFGAYTGLPAAYNALMAHSSENKISTTGEAIEVYTINSFNETDERKFETLVYFVVSKN